MPDRPTTADELRRAFVEFFTERAHAHVPSASVIPVDKSLLFTVAGMVPFKPFYTGVLKIDPDRLWVTVHEDDDEAEQIWRERGGFPAVRIQRLGDANFWRMADTGPCGPSSEIFWDLGPEFGPDGGPITDADRYIEIWNLVFMQFDQRADGTRVPLPKPSIDTGAGLERNLMVVQGLTSIWDVDVFRPLIARAEQVTGAKYGNAESTDVSLRIIAEHARAMTFIIADGVRPSNQERGYVLRRI